MLSELFDEKALREQYDIALMTESEARGEARGRAIGEAAGEARGRAIGEAAGEARGRAIGEAAGKAKGEENGFLKALTGLVKKGILTVSQAAEEANLSIAEFETKTGIKAT